MNNLMNVTKDELENYFLSIDEKKFKATQVFEWLYQKRIFDIEGFSNIKKEVRERLKKDFILDFIKIEKKRRR